MKFLVHLVLLLSSGFWTLGSVAAGNPNILFILADDLGYGDLRSYNPESKIPTPHLDTLTREGMRFTDAHSGGPLCHASRYALMTGQYPWRINVGVWPRQPLIKEGRTTLASVLRDQGYRTAMVGKWHLGFQEGGYDKPLPGGPADRGFDSFFGIRASTDIPPYFYIRDREAVAPPTGRIAASPAEPEDGWNNIQGSFWRAGGIAPGLALKDVLPKFTDEAIGVIGKHAASKDDKPLFLYLAYPAPHTPWLPSEEFVGKSGAGMYGDFLMMVDAMVGRVLAALEAKGMADNTLVFFSSDNGPVWYAANTREFGHTSMGALRGRKGSTWEAGHRMPFLVRWPGVIKPGTVNDQTIGFVDMVATAAELTGAKLTPGHAEDSFSFLPVLRGTQPAGQPTHDGLILSTAGGRIKSIRSGDWKLIDNPDGGGFRDRDEPKPPKAAANAKGQLYNLRKDLGETTNLWDEYPEIVARLTGRLKKAVADGHSAPHCQP